MKLTASQLRVLRLMRDGRLLCERAAMKAFLVDAESRLSMSYVPRVTVWGLHAKRMIEVDTSNGDWKLTALGREAAGAGT